jgi:hypothetical protein
VDVAEPYTKVVKRTHFTDDEFGNTNLAEWYETVPMTPAEVDAAARRDERAKVLADIDVAAHEMIGPRAGQCVGTLAPPSFPYWVGKLIERLRAEVR